MEEVFEDKEDWESVKEKRFSENDESDTLSRKDDFDKLCASTEDVYA